MGEYGHADACICTQRSDGFRDLDDGRVYIRDSHAAGECDRLVKESFKCRRKQHRHHVAAACGEAGDGDVGRVAAEILDVVAHPLKTCCDVKHGEVAGLSVLKKSRQAVEALQAETIVEGNIHDAIIFHHVAARDLERIPCLIVAAVDIDEDRKILCVSFRVNVKIQAVCRTDCRRCRLTRIVGHGAKLHCREFLFRTVFRVCPCSRCLRCLPAVLTRCVRAVRDTIIDFHVVSRHADDLAVSRLSL